MNNLVSNIYYPFKNVEINDLIFSKMTLMTIGIKL